MDKFDERYCYEGEVLTLDITEQSIVKNFINVFFTASAHYSMTTSYGLKHIVENAVGFYVSNADLKKAMDECGYKHKPCEAQGEINWIFNVSQKRINMVHEINARARYPWFRWKGESQCAL